MTFRYAELFAGVGGFRLGLDPIGGECVWACEIDKHARRAYCENHGVADADLAGDIRAVDAEDIPPYDLLVGGFPCQPFSKLGLGVMRKRGMATGVEDMERGQLFYDIVRLLAVHQPRAFLLENVPQLLYGDGGRNWVTILGHLDTVLGYQVSWRLISAYPYVPQHRERLFIAGYRDGGPDLHGMVLPEVGPDAPTLGDILHPEDGSEAPEPPYTDMEGKVDPRYVLTAVAWEKALQQNGKFNPGSMWSVRVYGEEDVGRTLPRLYRANRLSMLVHRPWGGLYPRMLTPREAARLMGMPDLLLPGVDSVAYALLGNAVVPPVITDLGDYMMHGEVRGGALAPHNLRLDLDFQVAVDLAQAI